MLRRFLVTLLRRSLLILLLVCLGCVAQSAPPDVARKIEHQVRSFYTIPAEVKVTVGAITPSTEWPGYDGVSVNIDGGDGKQKDYKFLLSKDRSTMLRLTKFDLTKDPFAELMSKIDVTGRPSRGAKSAKVVAINSWQPIGDYSLVLAKGKGTALSDLAGKTFATSGPGALPDQMVRLILKKYNIDDSTASFVQVGGHAARLQAVLAGRADAALVNTVTSLRSVQDGKVTVLTKLSKEFPGLGYCWNVVRADELADPERSAALQTLTEASIRAVRDIIANPDEAAEIMHEHVPELDVDYLKAVMRDMNSEHLWGVDGGLDPKIEEFTADLNVKLGNLTAAPAQKDVLDTRYVEVALKKLGPYGQK